MVMAAGTLIVIVTMPVLYHYFINPKYFPALEYSYLLCERTVVAHIGYLKRDVVKSRCGIRNISRIR